MNRFVYLLSLITAVLFFFQQQSQACGYSFIGGCSTGISLNINGTTDSFDIAECPYGLRFNGLDLGTVRALEIAKCRAVTWESCINNVSAVRLNWRVFPVGQTGGAWQAINLPEDYNSAVGPYTTRYRSALPNQNVVSGLAVGQRYVLEVFYRAEVDTIGDDFIPETEILQNNNGQNYRVTFIYGGPTAPPFTVVKTTQINPVCHGDSTGVMGVSVYGDQSNLFYAWSYYQTNFNKEFNVPAGTYTVTVTGAGGYAEIDTFHIVQPDVISAQFHDFQNVTCNNSQGSVTVSASGGTSPYQYLWTDGQTTAVAIFNSIGIKYLTITDSNGCKLDTATVIQEVDPMSLSGYGQTKFIQPCNASAGVNIVFRTNTNAQQPTYEWWYQNTLVSTADSCVLFFATLQLNINNLLVKVTDQVTGCTANLSQFTIFIVQPSSMTAFAEVSAASAQNAADGSILMYVTGGTSPYHYQWNPVLPDSNYQSGLSAGFYCCTVSDINGCTTTYCAFVTAPSATSTPDQANINIWPNPVAAGETLQLSTTLHGRGQMEIFDALGQQLSKEFVADLSGQINVSTSPNWPAGLYEIVVR
ncbi:MAG: T9SS type A sorting domain-containing protein, partial [Saprospiraceae bacterium]|nr:T9SS type A sorting domain-containing protein [Saprospiraceae bacterium]